MDEEILLSNSCETYVLDNDILISAFPGSVVFGKTKSNKNYIQDCSFKFTTFQTIELFKSLVAIISFFRGKENQKIEKILNVTNVVYYWRGDLVINEDNTQVKLVKFVIEKNSETSFQTAFTLENINSLIYLLRRCIISSLCLKDIEEQFIFSVIEHSKSEIKECKTNNSVAHKFVEKFFKDNNFSHGIKKASFIEILCYYNSIIIQIMSLTRLYYPN